MAASWLFILRLPWESNLSDHSWLICSSPLASISKILNFLFSFCQLFKVIMRHCSPKNRIGTEPCPAENWIMTEPYAHPNVDKIAADIYGVLIVHMAVVLVDVVHYNRTPN